ncbi:MAG: hypothetical protein JSS20_03100 [Proteobacteria bacterium]|nr:hypothetical protein [Pseudomonadota bacterium]
MKSRRALSGGAKDAYLARVVAAEPDIAPDVAERLAATLQNEIALVSLKRPARIAANPSSEPEAAVAEAVEVVAQPVEFDPYSLNVIVLFRTLGREALLAELSAIEDVANLRLLAREQQLGLAHEIDDAVEIRLAIIEAAERRIANRRAAAS